MKILQGSAPLQQPQAIIQRRQHHYLYTTTAEGALIKCHVEATPDYPPPLITSRCSSASPSDGSQLPHRLQRIALE